MRISKSFETLSAARPAEVVVDPVEALLDFQLKSQELDEVLVNLDEAIHSFEMYSLIEDTINAQGGVTKSLEIMFGENFSSNENMLVEASKEAFEWAETAWQWVKDFFAKILAWCRSLFTSTGTIKEKLLELKKKEGIQFPMSVPQPFGMGAVNKSYKLVKQYAAKMKEIAGKLPDKAPSSESAYSFIGGVFGGGKENNGDGKPVVEAPKTEAAPAAEAKPADAPKAEAAPAAAPEDKSVVDTAALEKEIEDWMVAVGSTEKEKAGKDLHIADKAALDKQIDEVIKAIDDSKAYEETFKTAQKEVEAIIKKFERSSAAKGSFAKIQKLTSNVGKICKKVANKNIELGYMIIQRAKVVKK